MTHYFQCRLEKETSEGLERTVGWIEERGAKVGAKVTLKGEEGWWTVATVATPGLNSAQFMQQKEKSRVKLGSLLEFSR